MPRRIFITVAEVSGDQHAAQLIRALRQIDPQCIVEGHGGPLMREAGAVIHFETTKNASMGWRGALRALEVWRLLRWTRRRFAEHRPDLLIGVDSPSMNFHFAKLARDAGVAVMQYVAPQLWAWREGRIRKVRKLIDHLACILPFEESWFGQRGVNATFVGHPLSDELDPARELGPPPGYPSRPPVVGLLAGSRRGEASANFPRLLSVADRLRREFDGIRFLAPTTQATHPLVSSLIAGSADISAEVGAFDRMVPQCDLCLTVSGTATLHVAGHGVPMVAVYAMNRGLVWSLGWLMKTDTFALVNLLAPDRRHIVPEFIPWYGSTDAVADCAISLLRDPAALAAQRGELLELVKSLERPGASMNAARLAMGLMGTNPLIPAGDPTDPDV